MFSGVVTIAVTCDVMPTGFLSALFAVVVKLHHSSRTGRQHGKEAIRIWTGRTTRPGCVALEHRRRARTRIYKILSRQQVSS